MRSPLPLLIAAAVLFVPVTRAADEPRATAIEKPDKPDVPALIKQLGDDDFKVRDLAGQQLRKLGKDALPALSDAAGSEDPEVAARAQSVTRQISDDLKPKPKPIVGGPNSGVVRMNGNVHVFIASSTVNVRGKSVSITNNNGVTTKETTVTEDGKTIKIREDADGIAVTTTEKKDDKETTSTVKAKDADALKKDNPDAFKLFEKHAKDAGVQINGGVGGGQIRLNIGGNDNDNADVQKAVDEAQKQAKQAQKEAEEALRRAREAVKEAEEARKKALEEK